MTVQHSRVTSDFSGQLPEDLDRLIEALDDLPTVTPDAAQALLDDFQGDLDARKLARTSPEGFCRLVLGSTDTFEIILIGWRPGQVSPVHGHGESDCGFRIIQGEACERRFETRSGEGLVCTGEDRYPAGQVIGAHPGSIHAMGNAADAETDLVTLHIYSPPLAAKMYADEDALAEAKAVAMLTQDDADSASNAA